ncbi:hypothetical protein FACS1894152_3110 [Bacilli bacterium]|nr:hypothetical protein FACS1894152_3110 [Bacilli bacterium]
MSENVEDQQIETRDYVSDGNVADRGVYTGTLKDGKPHGMGRLEYADGRIYEGSWEDGKRSGLGKFTDAGGAEIVCNWKDDSQDGEPLSTSTVDKTAQVGTDDRAKIEFKTMADYTIGDISSLWSGDDDDDNENDDYDEGVYTGSLKNNQPHGWGKFVGRFDGATYAGEWKNGKKEGYGEVEEGSKKDRVKKNYKKYRGKWKDNKKDGYGKEETWFSVYKGNWKNGKRNGYGEETRSDCDTVSRGNWKDGVQIDGTYETIGHYYNIVKSVEDNNNVGTIVYRYYGKDGQKESVAINYKKINELLKNKKIEKFEDLKTERAIVSSTVNSFDDLKKYTEGILRDEDNFEEGAKEPEMYITLLANISSVGELEYVRFPTQDISKTHENMTCRERVEFLLKSIEVDINDLSKKFVTLPLVARTPYVGSTGGMSSDMPHVVGAIIDLEKIRKLIKDGKDMTNEKFIYCHDSARLVGHPGYENYGLANLTNNCKFINKFNQQDYNSCWYNAPSSVLVAAKNPDLVGKIIDGTIETYDLGVYNCDALKTKIQADGKVKPNDFFNEFEIKQINMLQQIPDNAKIERKHLKNKEEKQKNLASLLVKRGIRKRIKNACRHLLKEISEKNATVDNLYKRILEKGREAKIKFVESSQILEHAHELEEIDRVQPEKQALKITELLRRHSCETVENTTRQKALTALNTGEQKKYAKSKEQGEPLETIAVDKEIPFQV